MFVGYIFLLLQIDAWETVYNRFLFLTQNEPRTIVGRLRDYLMKRVVQNVVNASQQINCNELLLFNLDCSDLTSANATISMLESIVNLPIDESLLSAISDLPLLFSTSNRYPFDLSSPSLYGARELRLKSSSICDRVRDIVDMSRFFSRPTYEFIWITGTRDTVDLPVPQEISRWSLPECVAHRGYTHVVETKPPFRVATTVVGFLESGSEGSILSVLHTLQVKIPLPNPDVFSVDARVQNCLAMTLLVFKSPVQPKVLIVPFNPDIDYAYNVIPRFNLSQGRSRAQHCSLQAVVTEIMRIQEADKYTPGYSLVEIINSDHAVFLRNDIIKASYAHRELIDPQAELNLARMNPGYRYILKPGHNTRALCSYLIDEKVQILSVSSSSLKCNLQEYSTVSARNITPDEFWAKTRLRVPGVHEALQVLLRHGTCDTEGRCMCLPGYQGALCENPTTRFHSFD
jgi:hypothetical protein